MAGALLLELTKEELDIVRRHENVSTVERNQIISITKTPRWNMDRVNQRNLPLDRISDVGGDGGVNTDVYIVDTGVQTDHFEVCLPSV